MEVLNQIIAKQFSTTIQSSRPIIGLGMDNEVWEILLKDGTPLIIRLNEEDRAARQYPKEKWFIEETTRMGIPGPKVLDIGYCENYSYMIQTKLEGQNGKLVEDKQPLIWRQMGAYAKVFSEVKSNMFGDGNPAVGDIDSWKRHINYNLGELKKGEDDPAIKHQAYSLAMQEKIGRVFEELQNMDFVSGIVHGDLHPRNTIINGETVYLIDWGTAEFHYQPHTEISFKFFLEKPNQACWDAFLEGLEISPKQFSEMLPLITKFHLLKRIDKLRWGIDQHPPSIPQFLKEIEFAISYAEKLGVFAF